MSGIENAFSRPLAPRGQVYVVANSATAATYVTPPDWKGQLVTFVAQTYDLVIRFGNSGVVADVGKVALNSSGVLAPHAASGVIVPAGSAMTFYVSEVDTHFGVDSSGASGSWCAFRSSGSNWKLGEPLPLQVNDPALRVVFEDYPQITLSSTDVTQIVSSEGSNFVFSEATNMPAYTSAASTNAVKPAATFTAGNSDRLKCSNATCADIFSGNNAFTLAIAFYRGATGAAHTLFSTGTTGTDNGRFDITLDASDDVVITRVDSSGSSSAATHATTMSTGVYVLTYTYDGAGTSALYTQRTSRTLSGTVSGTLGTLSHCTIGARAYNTSTINQFHTGEICEILAWRRALGTLELGQLHPWLNRRYGV